MLNEEVKIDPVAGTEYFKVPKHGTKDEIEVMQDFSKVSIKIIKMNQIIVSKNNQAKLKLSLPIARTKTFVLQIYS